MCGIAGIVQFSDRPAEHTIRLMTDVMAHRGPDADGFYVEHPVALGHRRLSIIDLSQAANQPMLDYEGRFCLIFNGEIYNFREVRQLLKEYPFSTNGDSEVILAAFRKWGVDCLNRLNGMFAFAIWDRQQRELVIARDRMGVKPVYYYHDDHQFLFASEVRALLKSGMISPEINYDAVHEFLEFQSIAFPHSIIKNVRQLEAGSFIKISANKNIESKKYWDIASIPLRGEPGDEAQVHQEVHNLLSKAVQRRMISDVPLGAFLSGGIDSSAVVGLMAQHTEAPVNTFNIGFEEQAFDEASYASIVAKKFNTRHTSIRLKANVFLDELLNGLNSMDTPSGDGVNTYVVSKEIRRSGLTVALSGIGGDELFAGYPFFTSFYKLKQRQRLWKMTAALRKLAASLVPVNGHARKDRIRQLLMADSTIADCYPVFRQVNSPRMITRLSAGHLQSKALKTSLVDVNQFPVLSQVSMAEYGGYTQHTLLKDTDQMSMAVSLEIREPFFDHELVEFVLGIPDQLKYPKYSKSLLVESLGDLLPKEIVHRPKQGFLFPWSVWMKKELRSFCEHHIDHISRRPFMHPTHLKNRWRQFLKNDREVRWMEMWLFIILDYWLQRNGVE